MIIVMIKGIFHHYLLFGAIPVPTQDHPEEGGFYPEKEKTNVIMLYVMKYVHAFGLVHSRRSFVTGMYLVILYTR